MIPTAALLAAIACGGPSSAPSPHPSPVAPTPAPEPPAPPPSGPGITLSGRILEVLPDGTQRPIAARQVSVEVEVDSPTDPQRGGWVPVAADGSYRLSGVPDNRFVKIEGVDTSGLRSSYRFCATNTITRGDTTLDVPLFLPGAALPGRTVSGRVFAMIGGQQTPLPGVAVYYRSRAYGPDAWGDTDRDGRYSLCGISAMPGTLYMFCGNDVQPFRQAIDIREDTIFDIDATSFYKCLYPG